MEQNMHMPRLRLETFSKSYCKVTLKQHQKSIALCLFNRKIVIHVFTSIQINRLFFFLFHAHIQEENTIIVRKINIIGPYHNFLKTVKLSSFQRLLNKFVSYFLHLQPIVILICNVTLAIFLRVLHTSLQEVSQRN